MWGESRMKEYWVNVYDIGYIWYGCKYQSREAATNSIGALFNKLIYRIHVRLK